MAASQNGRAGFFLCLEPVSKPVLGETGPRLLFQRTGMIRVEKSTWVYPLRLQPSLRFDKLGLARKTWQIRQPNDGNQRHYRGEQQTSPTAIRVGQVWLRHQGTPIQT